MSIENSSSIRKQIEQLKGKKEEIKNDINKTQIKIKFQTKKLLRYEKALEIVKIVGLETQKELEYHLAEQVSLALAAVFDDPYELKVEFIERRGKTEADILFQRRELKRKPIGNVGGGAIDVASFALRIAYWSMRQDKRTRPVFILDEPFSGLKGEEANKRALELVSLFSSEFGIQIIMISDERLQRKDIIEQADKVFYVSQHKGISKVKEIK